jgi:small subunit ribosomal protein S6
MATQSPLYDLVLMLSTEAEEDRRAKILADVEAAIARSGGSIERDDDWGRRPMAYEIRHQPEAEYHLLQFKAPGSMIEDLSHTLRITDGVVRFRVIKNRPGTPAAPSSPPPVVAAVAERPAPAARRSAPDEEAAPIAEETAPSAEQAAPAEEEPAPSAEDAAPTAEAAPDS